LGRPNVSAVVKTLVEREIQEVEIRSSAAKHRTINGRCRTGTIGRVIPPGCGVIAPRSIRPLSFTPYRLWRHPMVRPMISDNELQAPRCVAPIYRSTLHRFRTRRGHSTLSDT
jgi:hypothetical protein